MSAHHEAKTGFETPDYEYGNRSPIEVVRIRPNMGDEALDPHSSLNQDLDQAPGFTEAGLEQKITEIGENYTIVGDPKSPEGDPKHFGLSVVNLQPYAQATPAILMMSTSASSLYDEKGRPNNEGNALELAYTAFKYPDRPIVYVESPGNGNSVDLDPDEYASAMQNGRLVDATRDISGRIVGYQAFPTMESLARALADININVGYISSNASGAHFSTALMAALPEASVDRALLYNPTNISDRNSIALALGNLKEILGQKKYEKVSRDPLRLTDKRKKMARLALGFVPKRKIDLLTGSSHNPAKLSRQQQIFRRGNQNGQSAAVQAVVSQMRHPELKQTVIFPEFAAQYKDPEDFVKFMDLIGSLGGHAVESSDLQSLGIPLGQYGHSHYPTVRQTLEAYAFNR